MGRSETFQSAWVGLTQTLTLLAVSRFRVNTLKEGGKSQEYTAFPLPC